MPRLTAEGMGDYTPELPPADGEYLAHVVDVDTAEVQGRTKMVVRMRTTDGPEQPDGSPGEDKEITDFVDLSPYTLESDQQRRFQSAHLHNLLEAFGIELDKQAGFDTDDIRGESVRIKVQTKQSKTGDDVFTNVRKYIRAD